MCVDAGSFLFFCSCVRGRFSFFVRDFFFLHGRPALIASYGRFVFLWRAGFLFFRRLRNIASVALKGDLIKKAL